MSRSRHATPCVTVGFPVHFFMHGEQDALAEGGAVRVPDPHRARVHRRSQ
jgi:hypothetical protein